MSRIGRDVRQSSEMESIRKSLDLIERRKRNIGAHASEKFDSAKKLNVSLRDSTVDKLSLMMGVNSVNDIAEKARERR